MSSSVTTEEVRSARRLTLAMAAALLLAAVPAFVGTTAVAQAASRIDLARSANPYISPSAGFLLYAWTPLVVLSACILFTAPGLLISRALGHDGTLEEWVLSGFLLTIPILAIPTQVVELVADHPLRGRGFAAFVVVITLLCAVVAFRRATGSRSPLSAPGARHILVFLLLVPVILLIALAPKFHWESFNGDGVHALETLRLLLHQPLPFWDKSIPGLAMNPGTTSMLFAYPGSWFVRLFGEVDASARLPLVLYTSALLAAILALAQAGAPRRLGFNAVLALALALAYFASFYVQAYLSLHHFIPAVIFLLAAHWRFLASSRGARRGWTLATVQGALIALALSLPTRAALYLDGRELGSSVADLVGGYQEVRVDQFRAASLLQAIAPKPWTRGVPDTRYGEAALVWNRYARRNGVISNDVAYVLQSGDRPPLRGARLVARSNEAALYVLDENVLRRDRMRQPPAPAASPLYKIPREILFRLGSPPGGPHVVNVPSALRRLRSALPD